MDAETPDAGREQAVKAIVDAMPLLTAEQREQLRPILAGTIPGYGAENAVNDNPPQDSQ